MSAFQGYAEFYDVFNGDKHSKSESAFIHRMIQQYSPGATSILDLGCGTGRHAVPLAKMGYVVHGVDVNGAMLKIAEAHRAGLACEIRDRINFSEGDIRSVRLGRRYDAVVSLFHVLSYQTTRQDVAMTFDTVASHLAPNGVVLFDFWYGPAVLSMRPAIRVKRAEDDSFKALRVAEPTLYASENCVDVNYIFVISEKSSTATRVFEETHKMRYFFLPELCSFLEYARLSPVKFGEFPTGNNANLHTWSVFVMAKHASTMYGLPDVGEPSTAYAAPARPAI